MRTDKAAQGRDQSGQDQLRQPNGSDSPVDADISVIRSQAKPEPFRYVGSLDGLRGYALVIILIYHSRFPILSGGFFALTVFFTLSGFLITSLLLREWESQRTIDMRRFWSRRFRRLLPASWTTLGLVVVLGLLGVWDGDQLLSLRGDIPTALFQVVNWHFVLADRTYGAGFTAPTPVEHFWSLAVEEQFYFVIPVVIMGLLYLGRHRSFRRRVRTVGGVVVAIVVVSAVLNGALARSSIDRAYFGTDTRMAELLIGALLACVMARRLTAPEGRPKQMTTAVGWLGLVGLIALFNTGGLRVQWTYPWGLLGAAVCTAAIIAGALQGGVLDRILSFRPAAELGKISYGVYLLHWPIFVTLTPARTGISPIPLFALRLSISVLCALALFHLVEEPVRRQRRLLAHRFTMTLAVALPVIIAGTLLVTRNAEPTSVIQRSAQGSPTTQQPRAKRVMFVGDGAVAQLTSLIAEAQSDASDKSEPTSIVSSNSVDGCGLVRGGWVLLEDGRAERDVYRCERSVETWTGQINKERPDVVLIVPSERDAAICKSDDVDDWIGPEPPTGSDIRSVEMGMTVDSIIDAAKAAGSAVVMATTPELVDPGLPDSPLPERDLLRVELDRSIIDAAPSVGDFAPLSERLATINETARGVAEDRGIKFVDLGGKVADLAGGVPPIDLGAMADAGGAKAGKALLTWVTGIARSAQPPSVDVRPAPENLQNIILPEAPPAMPRLHAAADSASSMLVVGDSIAYGLGRGLEIWGTTNNANVHVGARFGCAVARGGRYKFQRDSVAFKSVCDWGEEYVSFVRESRPEVVLLSSTVWHVVDRQLPGDTQFRHIGDPILDRYILSEFLTAVDTLAAGGATVAILGGAYIESGQEKGFSGLPESDHSRMDGMNEILQEVVRLRPGVTKWIDLQGWIDSGGGRGMAPVDRPDGLHFSDQMSVTIGEWLGPQLDAIARGGA